LVFFLFWMFSLLYLSFLIMGSNWEFLTIYLNRLQITDLTPNYGIFWYFFILVFEQFQFFFLFVFNLHLLVLLIPLYIKFKFEILIFLKWRNEKFLLAFILIASFSMFNPYPTFSHTTFYFTIFILFSDTIKKLTSGIYYFFTLILGMTLGPVLFNTWVNNHSNNVNRSTRELEMQISSTLSIGSTHCVKSEF
jgi:GPI-anchor transamidase subunit U